ncbi:uncharacterized protein NECHADRAFT_76106 [Fusarium vanettenii 77-13-4]|uniref:Uncharacterized protein n=1 Tax=Fusarium vanettenii (strain ATCC MYA-4622 / CBS 123669 / FGSC 9596 / NRRL 45880 / 77-13-4) TaxID=660122 RepID=C7Z6H7_FUSV7|nr:uncharacterized protein NECHADRAFT_76106 [Fusarium vanettenii 77-13-4]EEU40133.1 predicted protein [Fusarium vanettenii 77-13-4]
MSAVAANAAATSIATSKEVNEIKANMNKLRDQLVNKVTPVLVDPTTEKRANPAVRNPAARSSTAARGGISKANAFLQQVAKPAKKRAPRPAKSTGKTGASNGDEISWD